MRTPCSLIARIVAGSFVLPDPDKPEGLLEVAPIEPDTPAILLLVISLGLLLYGYYVFWKYENYK